MSFSFMEFAVLLVLLGLITAILPPVWAAAWVTFLVMVAIAMWRKIASELRAERREEVERKRQRQAEEAAEQLRRAPALLAEKVEDADLKTALLAFQSMADCWEGQMQDNTRLEVLRGRHNIEVMRKICADMIGDPVQGGEARLLESVRTISRKLEAQMDRQHQGRLAVLDAVCGALDRQCA